MVQVSLLVFSFSPISPQDLAIKQLLLQWIICFSKLFTSFNFPKILQQAVLRGVIRIAVKQRVQKEFITDKTSFGFKQQGPSLSPWN